MSQCKCRAKGGTYLDKRLSCPLCQNVAHTPLKKIFRWNRVAEVVVCDACSLCFRLQKWSKIFVKKHYQYISRQWRGKDSLSLSQAFNDRYHRIAKGRFCFIYHFLSLNPKTDFICEVGCYDGVNLYPWKIRGFQTLGFEFDPEASKIALHHHIPVIHQDFLEYDFSERKPSLMILSHVLEHLDDIDHYVSKIREVLLPHGYLFVEVPGIRSEGFGHLDTYLDVEHVFHFELNTLKKMLEKHGFSLMYGDEYIRAIFSVDGRKIKANTYQVVSNSIRSFLYPSIEIKKYLTESVKKMDIYLLHKVYFVCTKILYYWISFGWSRPGF